MNLSYMLAPYQPYLKKKKHRTNKRTLLDSNNLFVEFKGALTEQYVFQQLTTLPRLGIYYYTNERGSCEVDFVIDDGIGVTPIEVKAEINLRAKSLKTYCEKYMPNRAIRTSMTDYKVENTLINLPLYAIEEVKKVLQTFN